MKYPTSQQPGYKQEGNIAGTRQDIHYAGTKLGRKRNWNKMDSYKDSGGMATIPEQVQDRCYAALIQLTKAQGHSRDGNSTTLEQCEKPTLNRDAAELNRSGTETKRDTHAAKTRLGIRQSRDKMNSYKGRIGMEMAPKKAQRQNGDNTWSVSRNRDDTVDATTRWIQSQNTSGGTSRMNSQDVSGSRDGTKTQPQSLEKPEPGRCKGKTEPEWTTTNVNHPDEQHQMQLPQRKIPGAELKKATAVEENLGCRRHFSEARRKERSIETLHQVPLRKLPNGDIKMTAPAINESNPEQDGHKSAPLPFPFQGKAEISAQEKLPDATKHRSPRQKQEYLEHPPVSGEKPKKSLSRRSSPNTPKPREYPAQRSISNTPTPERIIVFSKRGKEKALICRAAVKPVGQSPKSKR